MKSSLVRRLAAFAVFCLVVLAVACSDEEPPAGPVDGGNGGGDVTRSWKQQQPLPCVYDLHGLHSTPAGRLVAVGAGGVILTHDGDRWLRMDSPTESDLWDVHGAAHDNLWAVGDGGAALRFDGSTWHEVNVRSGYDLRGVHVLAPDTLYAVGMNGPVLFYQGVAWSQVSPIYPPVYGVWATALDNVYAVGEGNRIYHYEGASTWTIITDLKQPNVALRDIWGTSPRDIYAVGDAGYTARYDGSEWKTIQAPTTETLHAVSGSGWGLPTAVGANGTVLTFRASRWRSEDSGTRSTLRAVDCNTDAVDQEHRVAAGRYTIVESGAGGDWAGFSRGTTPALNDLWGVSQNDVFAVGRRGAILHFDGSGWTMLTGGEMDNLVRVWGNGEDILVADEHGAVHTGGVAGWTRVGGFQSRYPEYDVMNDAWQIPGGELICVGESPVYGTGVFAMRGGVWARISPDALGAVLTGVWGRSDNHIIAVGLYGQIIRYEGTRWELMNSGTTERLASVWGTERTLVFAVGYNGTMLYYDGIGNNWQAINTGLIQNLHRVWGTSPANVLAVGEVGAVVRFDGFELTPIFVDTTAPLYGVWQDQADNVYVAGGYDPMDGIIFRTVED